MTLTAAITTTIVHALARIRGFVRRNPDLAATEDSEPTTGDA
jgi:hypothetical protein